MKIITCDKMKALVLKTGTNGITDKLTDVYINGLRKKGHDVSVINIYKLKFDPILRFDKKQNLEPDLKNAQKLIKNADHIAIFFPNWWATMPAAIKGFLDRTLTSGFAFKYSKKGIPAGLLKGKTGFALCVTAAPKIYNLFMGTPGLRSIKKNVFGFCGIKTKTFRLDNYKKYEKDKQKYKKLIKKIEKLGEKYNGI